MVRLKTHPKEEWGTIVAENSGITPRYNYESVHSDATNDSKMVIRGWQEPQGGGPDQVTQTGFLKNETGTVVAGIDAIPREAVDTETVHTEAVDTKADSPKKT